MPDDGYVTTGLDRFAALPDEVRKRIAKARLCILDVDGVLTDGGLYYAPDGTMRKRFHVHDGLGIEIARQSGLLEFAVITGMDQPAVAARLKDLGIKDYFPGFKDKRECCDIICKRHKLSREEIAFLGDDWIDLPVMAMVGVPLAVGNAQPETKAAALYVTEAHGGNGAVREAIRLMLYCKKQLNQVFDAWMKRYRS